MLLDYSFAMKLKTLGIVTSALNEEECLNELYSRIKDVMSFHPTYEWHLKICDNGSSDNTWTIIRKLAESDDRVTGIRMSRTFTLDGAFTFGINNATEDAIIIMASDLQDPPEVFHDFLTYFEKGYEQVVGKVVKRDHVPFLRRHMSTLFYILANRFTGNIIPRGVSDFRLLSRTAYLGARQLNERNRFLRGLIAWTGYKTATVEIERPKRFAGDSKFVAIKFKKVVGWALSAILVHTTLPLTAISVLGFVFSGLSTLMVVLFSILWVADGVPFAGFGTIVGLICLGFSLILLSLGVIAKYLALIYEEVKNRPSYLVAETFPHVDVQQLR